MNLGMQLKSPTVHGTYKKNAIHSFIHLLTHSFIYSADFCTHPVLAPIYVRDGAATRRSWQREVIGPSLTLSVEPAVKP